MGKEWETKQVDKLVKKQRAKIAELKEKVEKDHPAPGSKRAEIHVERTDSTKRISPEDPDRPINS